MSLLPFLALLCSLPYIWCWGDLGHRTTAYLASLYLTPAELEQIHYLTGFNDISDAAVWADRIVHHPHFTYSAHWHYLNVDDNPPAECGIELGRDHSAGSSDILSAFVNHSSLATSKDSTPAQLREAYRFLIHWIGDIHQPLHAEGEAVGGTRIPVKFDREATNLHAVWDVYVPQKLRQAQDHDQEAAKAWAADIYGRFSKDPLPNECHTVDDAFTCILHWAVESNALVCEAVLKHGTGSVWRRELGDKYYENAKVVVEARVAAAGRRMAVWLRTLLNTLASDGMWHEDVAQQPMRFD